MEEIVFRHGDIINILGKSWLIDFIKAENGELFVHSDGETHRFYGLAVTTERGGVITVVMDRGNPQQTLAHEICEAFLTEMERTLHEEGTG